MSQLLEKYTNRLARTNNEFKARTGRNLTEDKKILTAALLENTAKFMNYRMGRVTEALDNSVGVQTSDIGAFKRFVLDVTEVTTPNLIAPEICMIKTMDAMTGYAIFRKYTANSRKGVRNSDGTFNDRMNLTAAFPASKDVLRGTLSNGKPQSEYTSSVVEQASVALSTTATVLRWTPIVPGSIFAQDTTYTYADDGAGKLVEYTTANIDIVKINGIRQFFTKGTTTPATPTDANFGTVDYGSFRDSGYADNSRTTVFGSITLASGTLTVDLEYQYNNEYIPQNDIPLIGVSTDQVYLHAKARRIAIYYSQLAEFEAQKDYGFALGDDLRKQAEFQLQFEVDTEVVETAVNLGKANSATGGVYASTPVVWHSVPPLGVNMRDHYETINVAIATADAYLYQQTQKFSGTYILVGPLGLRYFSMNSAYKMLSGNKFGYGPYVAGECAGKKVIVTPIITDGSIYVGVNTPDASALIYGIYMPIVPTQLLQFADGGNSQGFSTLYDLQVLNPQLVFKISVEETREEVTVTVDDGE